MRGFSQALRYRTRLPPVCAPIWYLKCSAYNCCCCQLLHAHTCMCSSGHSSSVCALQPKLYVRYKRGGQLKSNLLRQVAVAGTGHVVHTQCV